MNASHHLPTRRDVLRVAGAGAALSLGGLQPAFAAGSITAATFPGAWETAHRTFLIPSFQKSTGATVNLAASMPLDIVAKTLVSRNNPAFDVFVADEGSFAIANAQGLIETIPASRLPNLKDLPAKFVDPKGQAFYVSAQVVGIAYNTEKIKTPPSSWDDLLKPEFKGRVGVVGFGSALGPVWLTEVARMRGGSEENMDPAFDFLRQLLPNIGAVAPSPGALATLIQQGQVDICAHYSNNVGDLQAKGVPVALAKPNTGWGIVRTTMHVVKNTKEPALAAAYINAALDPEVQARLADSPYYLAPTNTKVAYTKGLQQYAKDAAELEAFKTIDWVKLSTVRQAYIDRFNRDMKV
jgi:putative spermidine/putrescine transport system substrate-binding protein